MGTAPGRVMTTTRYWGPPLPAGREPRRLAQSGHTILGVGRLRRAAPFHGELPTPGRANGPRLGGCANRVCAPTGVSVRFRRCAACRWRGPWPGAPLAPEREPAPRGLSVELLYAGRACPLQRSGYPLPTALAFVACLCERQNSNPLTQEDQTSCLHRNPSPKSASGRSRPRFGGTAPPISRGTTSPVSVNKFETPAFGI